MSYTFDEISLTYKPSCTLEEAALYMMGFPQSYLQPRWLQYSDDPVSYTHLDVYKRQLVTVSFVPRNVHGSFIRKAADLQIA